MSASRRSRKRSRTLKMKPGWECTACTYLLLPALSGAIKFTYNCVLQAPPTRLSPENDRCGRLFSRGRGAEGDAQSCGRQVYENVNWIFFTHLFYILFYWERNKMKYEASKWNISLQEDMALMHLLLWLAVGQTWIFVSWRKLFSFHKKGIVGLHVESFTRWT